MKGILKKTPAGWFVWYSVMRDEITQGYESLPLHPTNEEDFMGTVAQIIEWDGMEVEFEIVDVYHELAQVGYRYVNYAKLIAAKEQTNGERFEEFMRTVEGYPELEGTMNLCEDIIEKKTGKMTEEEWQAAERAQTEPKQETLEEAAKEYDRKSTRWGAKNIFIDGAKWQEKRMYSEEEVKKAFKIGFFIGYGNPVNGLDSKDETCEEWFKQFKKK